MGCVEEVATYLDAQSALFTAGTNLFANYMPDRPATASVLFEYVGAEPVRTFGIDGIPAWEAPRLQLITRSSSSTRARDNAEAAWTILEAVANQTVSGTAYLRISALQSPFLVGQDNAGRYEYGFNVECWRVR